MHNANWYVQRPLHATSLNEQGIMEQVSFPEETSDHAWRWRLSGLTLAETEHQVHEVTVRF